MLNPNWLLLEPLFGMAVMPFTCRRVWFSPKLSYHVIISLAVYLSAFPHRYIKGGGCKSGFKTCVPQVKRESGKRGKGKKGGKREKGEKHKEVKCFYLYTMLNLCSAIPRYVIIACYLLSWFIFQCWNFFKQESFLRTQLKVNLPCMFRFQCQTLEKF